MKLHLIILTLFFTFFISCKKESDTIIKYEFYPAFNNPSEFTINTEEKTLRINSFKKFYYEYDSITQETIRIDSLIQFHNQIYPLNNKKLDVFLEEISDLDSTKVNSESILDGITYRISKITSKKDTTSLTSNLHRRNDKSNLEYTLLDAFFKFTESEIKTYEGNFIVESVQSYFSYNEKVKKIKYKLEKISENPIEYKIWGNLNGCKNNNGELVDFLNKLPNNEPIIFDLRKGNFSECLYKTFIPELENKKLYFYGDYKMRDFEERVNNLKREIKEGKYNLPKTENEKMIDELLGEPTN